MCLNPSLSINPNAYKLLPICNYVCIHGRNYPCGKLSIDAILQLSGYKSLNYTSDGRIKDTPEAIDAVFRSTFVVSGSLRLPWFQLWPCGRCSICKDSYRRELESRCLLEASDNPYMVFFTLTYDNKHLPPDGLNKSHVSAFLKRFRINLERAYTNKVRLDTFTYTRDKNIFKNSCDTYTLSLLDNYHFRAVYVGEYGVDFAKSRRAHYHGILFFDKPIRYKDLNNVLNIFANTWTNGRLFGFDVIKNPEASARYICKYITKSDINHVPPGKNACFFQGPHKCGLGSLRLHERRDDILNSVDGCISVRFETKIKRIKIPTFLLQKIFPSLSKLCPEYYYKLTACDLIFRELNRRMPSLSPSHVELFKGIQFGEYALKTPFLRKSLKRRITLLATFLPQLDDLDLLETYYNYATKVISSLPCFEDYLSIILSKCEWYDNLNLPDQSITEQLTVKSNIALNNFNYVHKHLQNEDMFVNLCIN